MPPSAPECAQRTAISEVRTKAAPGRTTRLDQDGRTAPAERRDRTTDVESSQLVTEDGDSLPSAQLPHTARAQNSRTRLDVSSVRARTHHWRLRTPAALLAPNARPPATAAAPPPPEPAGRERYVCRGSWEYQVTDCLAHGQ